MQGFTHHFEEIEILLDHRDVLVSGSVGVEYQIFGPEPDVGISSAWAEWIPIGTMTVTVTDIETELVIFEGQWPANCDGAEQILKKEDDSIQEACMEDANEEAW